MYGGEVASILLCDTGLNEFSSICSIDRVDTERLLRAKSWSRVRPDEHFLLLGVLQGVAPRTISLSKFVRKSECRLAPGKIMSSVVVNVL